MCRMASFIVTKQKVFWSKETDAHEDIIVEFDLQHLDRDLANIGLVRTEIIPPDNDYTRPITEWEFRTDQDITPDWYNAAKAERRNVSNWIVVHLEQALDEFCRQKA